MHLGERKREQANNAMGGKHLTHFGEIKWEHLKTARREINARYNFLDEIQRDPAELEGVKHLIQCDEIQRELPAGEAD